MADHIKVQSFQNNYGIAGADWLWIGALFCIITLGVLFLPRLSHASGPERLPPVQSSIEATCGTDYSYFDIEPVPCDPSQARPQLVSSK